MEEVKEVWENQRFYGAGWFPPPQFERHQWTDESGTPVSLPKEYLPEKFPMGWTVVVDDSTDYEGWEYSTAFSRIGNSREGGRASKRATDGVRRRKWLFVGEGNGQVPLPERRKERPLTMYRGLRAFVQMFAEVLQRRQIWEVLPWDPGAWLVVHAEHQEYMRAVQSLQLKLQKCLVQSKIVSKKNLEDMVCAVVHSRAAYGYAMAAGHMDSVDSVLKMHTFHNKYFDPVAGASVEANVKAVCTLAGIAEKDILMSEWSNSQYRPCHYIAVDRKRKKVVLVIRGSSETGDVITDITGAPLSVTFGHVHGNVHEGLMSAATYVQCKTAPALEKAAKQYKGWPLFITGHSLGGGVAQLLAMLLNEEDGAPKGFKEIKCVGIGPAAVMSEPLAEHCRSFVTSVVFRSDVVPRLSCASVESLLLELTNASPTRKAIDDFVQTASAALQKLKEKLFKAEEKFAVNIKNASGGLTGISSLAQDSDAVAGAVHAATLASHTDLTTRIGSIELQSLDDTTHPPTQPPPSVHEKPEPSNKLASDKQAVKLPHTQQESSSRDASGERMVIQGGGGRFTPLFPAGQVFWILGFGKTDCEDNEEEPWWEKFQNWGRETLKKSQSKLTGGASDKAKGSIELEDVAGGSNPVSGEASVACMDGVKSTMSRDLEWIEQWLAERFQSKDSGDEGGEEKGEGGEECEEQDVGKAPEIDKDMERAFERVESSRGSERRTSECLETPVLVEADRKSFGRILLNPDMMNDHLPNGYLRAISMMYEAFS